MPSTLTSALLLNIYFLSIRTKENVIDIHYLNSILLILKLIYYSSGIKFFVQCTLYESSQ